MSWLWSGGEKRSFNVMIYEEDYKELCALVLKKPNIETGGDLFGLWADKHTAVIQLVLGPGKQCTRTTTSFYQDIDYLRRVGSYLTQNEGVCHIGEWHSHHQLGLARPSGGDENTVWNNMPTYNLKRFVIFIANIRSSEHSYNVNVGCFLFEIDDQGKHMDVLPGKFTILQKKSPLSGKKKVAEERKKGAEKDDENKIAIKELKMEVKEGEKRPSVTYLKPKSAPSERKRGNRGNHLQPANQNKPNDEESSVGNKKRKMNTEERSPDKSSGIGKKSPEGSPPSEDLKNLTINNERQEETSEEAMEQEKEKEEPEKNSQEEFKHEEQHDSERGKSQGKKAGNIKENDEAGPPQTEQGKTENEGKPRPLPKLAETVPEKLVEKTPEAKTQKQKEEDEETASRRAVQSGVTTAEEKRDSKDCPSQGSRPLPTVEGNQKKLEIKIAAIKTTPQPRGVEKVGSSQTGSRKSPRGSLPGEDVNKVTTNDEQPDENAEEAMKEQEEREGQEKKNQEEVRRDEQHDKKKGKSQGKGENLEKDKEAGSSQVEQEKVEKKSKPKPGKEATPGAKTQKKKERDKETTKTRAAQSGPKKAGSSQTGSTKGTKKQK